MALSKALNLMDAKRSYMVKTLNIMDANIKGFTVYIIMYIDIHTYIHIHTHTQVSTRTYTPCSCSEAPASPTHTYVCTRPHRSDPEPSSESGRGCRRRPQVVRLQVGGHVGENRELDGQARPEMWTCNHPGRERGRQGGREGERGRGREREGGSEGRRE